MLSFPWRTHHCVVAKQPVESRRDGHTQTQTKKEKKRRIEIGEKTIGKELVSIDQKYMRYRIIRKERKKYTIHSHELSTEK